MSRYCILCGTELIIGGNEMLSSIDDTIVDNDDDAIITNATCPNCQVYYEMTDATQNERKEIEGFVGIAHIFKHMG